MDYQKITTIEPDKRSELLTASRISRISREKVLDLGSTFLLFRG